MCELIFILLFSIFIPLSMFAQMQTESGTQTVHSPILIIPGILGTKISKNYGDNAELWPRITALATSPEDPFLEDLGLAKDGTEIIERPMRIGDIVRSISFGIDVHPYLVARVSVTASHIFDRFIEELEAFGYEEGVDLFVFPYDWRLDNESHTVSIKKKIEEIINATGRQKITIVAHSMGGLLAKEYLAKYGAGLIENIFFIGTPHLGAPKAFKALMYGDNMGIKIPMEGKFTSLLNPKTVKSISQNMSSVYELLPSEKYIEANRYVSKDDKDLNETDTADLMESSGRNASLVNAAKKFHADIDNLDIPTNTYNFIGCDDKENTLGGVEIRKSKPWRNLLGKSEEYLLHFVKGDETVPIASAFLSGANNFFIKGVSHGELPSANGLGTFVANAINGVENNIPASISSDASICGGIEGIIVSKHSPVEMHIYDEYGNHTGPVETGDIEYGIPNVTYEQIEDTAYAFIPTGEKYQVVNIPTNEGAFDLYAEYVDKDGVVIKKQIWSEVSIQSVDSRFELKVSDNGIDTMEETIHDNVNVIPPESVLTGDSLLDKEPPKTMAINNEDSVTLNASDNVSGVGKIEYSLDGGTWEEYVEPIKLAQGDKIFFLSIDKAGNLEDEKTFVASLSIPPQHKKGNTSGSKPITNASSTVNNIRTEPVTEVMPIQETKKETEVKPEIKKQNNTLSRKIVARKGVKVKRRVTNATAEKKEEKSNEIAEPIGLFKIIWSKVKSALYYVIWHMKAIIS